MGDDKDNRLGLRGRLAHMESALRLLGGANATGAIATGIAFHTFENNADIQIAMKTAVVLFLFGVFTFTIAYAALFLATDVIDYSMHKQGEETWPEYLFWVPDKSAEEYKTMAKWEFGIALFGGLASFSIFIVGLLVILAMATHFQLGLRFASFNCFASSYRRTTASGDGSRPHDSLLAAFRFVAFLSSSPLKSAAGPKARGTAHTNFVTL